MKSQPLSPIIMAAPIPIRSAEVNPLDYSSVSRIATTTTTTGGSSKKNNEEDFPEPGTGEDNPEIEVSSNKSQKPDQPESTSIIPSLANSKQASPKMNSIAPNGVAYTMYYSKVKGESRHMVKLEEKDFDNIKESAAKAIFEVTKEVKTLDRFAPCMLPEEESRADPEKPPLIESVIEERIHIYSQRLLRAVTDVVEYWPSHGYLMSTNGRSLDLVKPYRSLGSYREAFDIFCSSKKEESRLLEMYDLPNMEKIEENKNTVREVRLLMAEVDKHHASLVVEEKARHNREIPMATFEMLWLLFPPGVLTYAKIDGVEIACMVRMLVWRGGERNNSTLTSVVVHLWYLDYNGISESGRES